MQVTPAQLCVCYADIGIHWYPEVAPESFILDSKLIFLKVWDNKSEENKHPGP